MGHEGQNFDSEELMGYFQVEEGIDRQTLLRLYSQVMDGARKVFAPFGLPARLLLYCPRALLLPRHTAVFESVLDAVSEQVYQKEGLTETAVAVAMHRFVDEEGDDEIREAVMAMQGALNLIWEPSRVVALPDGDLSLPVGKDDFLALVSRLKEAYTKAPPEHSGPAGKKDRAVALWRALQAEGVDGPSWVVHEALSGLHALDEEVRRQVEEATCLSLAQDDLITALREMLDEAGEAPPEEGGKARLMGEMLGQFVNLCDELEDGEDALSRGAMDRAMSAFTEAIDLLEEQDSEDEGEEGEEQVIKWTPLADRLPRSTIARVYLQRASCFIAMGEAEEALEDLTAAIAMDDNCAPAFQMRGQVRVELGAPTEEVVADYCRAYALEGLKLPSELQALERALKEECRVEALALLQAKQAAARGLPAARRLPARWLMDAYFTSFAGERGDGALRRQVPSEGPEDTPADRLLRDALEQRVAGRYEDAWASLCAALSTAAASGEGEGFHCPTMESLAHNQHGSFLYLLGDLENAESALQQAVSLAPEGSHLRVNGLIKLGEVLCDAGRVEEGVERLHTAVAEAGPSDCDPLLHRGQIHLTHDDVVAAVNDLRRAIAIGSTSATQFTSAYLPNSSVSTAVPPVAYACLGTALFKLEEGAVGGQAESTLQQALDTHPDSFEVLLYYGDIMAEKGDIVQAIQRFSEAHLMDPSSPLPFVHASRAYMTVRDLTLAEKHLRRALELDPTCSASYLDLGQVEVQRGRSEAALECLEKGMAQARYLPELQDALVFRRLATLQLEQKRKAAREG